MGLQVISVDLGDRLPREQAVPTVVIEHNLTVAGAPGIGLEPGRAELDGQFERLEGVVGGVGLCTTMRKEHRWGPSGAIRVVITAYRGTSPAVRHTRNGAGRSPFGAPNRSARRLGGYGASVPLSLLLPALAVVLALGSLTVGLRTVERELGALRIVIASVGRHGRRHRRPRARVRSAR